MAPGYGFLALAFALFVYVDPVVNDFDGDVLLLFDVEWGVFFLFFDGEEGVAFPFDWEYVTGSERQFGDGFRVGGSRREEKMKKINYRLGVSLQD